MQIFSHVRITLTACTLSSKLRSANNTPIRNIELCIKKTDNIWLFSIDVVFLISVCCEDSAIQRFDGWYNNLAYPSWGTTGQYARCITVLI